MKLMKKFIILFSLLALNECFNINMSSISEVIEKEAPMLAGQPTSHFPNEAFINYVLYGHADVNFTYKDFMNSYGHKVSKPMGGYLIIGNDTKFGGIIEENSIFVIVPLPGTVLTEILFSQIKDYFPNGYTIIATKDGEYRYGSGKESSTYGEISNCDNCNAGFLFGDDYRVNPLQINNFIGKWQWSRMANLNFVIYGYLKEFDYDKYQGTIQINIYEVYGEISDRFFLVNDNYQNYISISSSNRKNLTYKGSIYSEIPNYPNFYNFSGWWSP